MRLYKEAGVNPLGCLSGQLIQMPLFIALYQVIRVTLGGSPESILDLSGRLYDVPFIQDQIPLSRQFIGMDLGANGGIALLVVLARCGCSAHLVFALDFGTVQSEQLRQTAMMVDDARCILLVRPLSPAGVDYWFASTVIGIIAVGPARVTSPGIAGAEHGVRSAGPPGTPRDPSSDRR
jgi:membrane protein insertase Oxa1/YidC/SpoIIIJ